MELEDFRQFLQVYNKIAENCFTACIYNFKYRDLDASERECVDLCTMKMINANNRFMQQFTENGPLANKQLESTFLAPKANLTKK